MISKFLRNRQKYYIPILIVQVFSIAFLYGLQPKNSGSQIDYSEISTDNGSIYDILPYDGDDFAIYYYEDTQGFTVKLRDFPFDKKIQEALDVLHQYEETKDITEYIQGMLKIN